MDSHVISKIMPQIAAWLAPKATIAMTAWSPLVGGKLELAASGYVITLRTDATVPPYALQDPDGRLLATSYLLQPLKEYAETNARDRAEFEAAGRT